MPESRVCLPYTKETHMRTLAIGLITVAGIAIAAPAVAEDFYVGGRGGGFGVEVDSGYRHHRDWDRDRGYRREGYRSFGYDRGERCRTTIIREHGMVRKIQRCRR